MHLVLSVIPQRLGNTLPGFNNIGIMTNVVKITDVWAWEKYYKQAEVVERIDVELLPTEAAVNFHQIIGRVSKTYKWNPSVNQQMD